MLQKADFIVKASWRLDSFNPNPGGFGQYGSVLPPLCVPVYMHVCIGGR